MVEDPKYYGSLNIVSEPDKLVYRIGENLDLTGGIVDASGIGPGGMMWDTFYQPMDSEYFVVDSSEFDNTKAGTYTIYIAPSAVSEARKCFTVTVVDAPVSTDVYPGDVLYGDANDDDKVTISDAVAILQYIANKDKYGLSDKGKKNADCCDTGDGITARDALAIQQLDSQLISSLPV